MGFYMLGIGLVAYIFHEMDERSKDAPRTKGFSLGGQNSKKIKR